MGQLGSRLIGMKIQNLSRKSAVIFILAAILFLTILSCKKSSKPATANNLAKGENAQSPIQSPQNVQTQDSLSLVQKAPKNIAGFKGSFKDDVPIENPKFLVEAFTNAEGKQWVKWFGGKDNDMPNFMIETSDGGYLLAGWTQSFEDNKDDWWIMKMTPFGNILWSKIYGRQGEDKPVFLEETSDGNYVIAGTLESETQKGTSDFNILELNKDGEQIWNHIYPGHYDAPSANLIRTKDQGYVFVANNFITDRSFQKMSILRLNAAGELVWGKEYDSSYFGLNPVAETSDGGFLIAGCNSVPFVENGNKFASIKIRVVKLSTEGKEIWQKIYGDKYPNYATAITQMSDGGHIITGKGSKTQQDGAIVSGLWVLILDAKDIPIYENIIALNDNAIKNTADSLISINGKCFASNPPKNVLFYNQKLTRLIELDQTGKELYRKEFEKEENAYITSNFQAPGDDCLLAAIVNGNWSDLTEEQKFKKIKERENLGRSLTSLRILKINSKLDQSWSKEMPVDIEQPIIMQTKDGGYLLAGTNIKAGGLGHRDIIIMKLDPNRLLKNSHLFRILSAFYAS